MGWLSLLKDMFGPGSSDPDHYDKMFRARMAREQKERDEIFDISKNVDQINERRQDNIINYRRSQLKERKEQIREKRKKEDKAIDALKIVIDTAKLQCNLCTNPIGDLKVNYNTPSIQGKRTATVKEKDQTSLLFKGNCKKSPNSSSPCNSVMQLGNWKDIGNVKFQEEYVLLQKSTIKCNYGGTDIQIIDCGQRNVPTDIDTMPMEAIKEKQILSTTWMCEEMEEEIRTVNVGKKVSLLVKTRNYQEGDTISVKIKGVKEQEINEGINEIVLTGTVNAKGFAELKEEIEFGTIAKNTIEKTAKEQKPEQDNKNKSHVIHEGKSYTREEWKAYQNDWHDLMDKRNNEKKNKF
ncbi:DUF4280 domain-containing protein [Flavobacterium bizetiae]|uniref:DUF4280 domain-containing protein n=1 Tax=Flavobacterium bizetiae TaxID=2704140 RepID=UPI0021E748D1|nr:DUF4280 domain-containing protein [Flavobacterium bizetiae]UTN03466.1 DUF4280 domain-containing protein [Flavobacterium bizetiae]